MTCVECKTEASTGKKRCDVHLEKARESQKKYRAANADKIKNLINERYRTDEIFRESRKAAANRARKKDPELNRRNNLLRNYNMTLAEWESLFLFQGQRCALCYTDIPGGRGAFHVDHDHVTNEIRGLLCHWCNTSLERAEIDGWLKRVATYLGKEK